MVRASLIVGVRYMTIVYVIEENISWHALQVPSPSLSLGDDVEPQKST